MKKKKQLNAHAFRVLLTQKLAKRIKKEYAFVKCEKCGKYFPLAAIECHHAIISVSELHQEYKKGVLSMEQAKALANDSENMMMVCHECHEKLHTNIN